MTDDEKFSVDRFTPETFDALRQDLKSGRIDSNRIVLSDGVQLGLRATVHKDKPTALVVSYTFDDQRPFFKIGEIPVMTVKRARIIAAKIRDIAQSGIDPFEQMREQFINSLGDV